MSELGVPEANPESRRFSFMMGSAAYRVCWHDWGDREAARTVLCLPALNRNGRDFDAFAQALAHKGCRVLCLDLPGRGDSDRLDDPADYNHQTYLKVIKALLECAGVEGRPIDVVGTSLGGILGMMLAAENPDCVGRLVLNDVGTVTSREVFQNAARSIAREMRFRSFDQAVLTFKIMTASCGPLTDAEWYTVSRRMIEPAADGGFTLRYDPKIAAQLLRDAENDLDLTSFYEAIRAPVLLVRGEKSNVLTEENARVMMQTGPRARCYTAPGTGHFPMLINKDEILTLTDFLLNEASQEQPRGASAGKELDLHRSREPAHVF